MIQNKLSMLAVTTIGVTIAMPAFSPPLNPLTTEVNYSWREDQLQLIITEVKTASENFLAYAEDLKKAHRDEGRLSRLFTEVQGASRAFSNLSEEFSRTNENIGKTHRNLSDAAKSVNQASQEIRSAGNQVSHASNNLRTAIGALGKSSDNLSSTSEELHEAAGGLDTQNVTLSNIHGLQHSLAQRHIFERFIDFFIGYTERQQ